ncbi:type IA DNA topoisomerase [archaeon]|nr:MAG: type IA DNA topoisomerase [archaeon]
MVKVLCVAEKPSVAKELARVLGGGGESRRDGCSKYNAVFEIPNGSFRNQPAHLVITSVSGHLMELEFDPAFKSWSSCSPVELFTAPVHKHVKKENEDIKKTLVREAKHCQVLFLWLDCDSEGENIAFEVIKVCMEANPRLDVFRARFSSLQTGDVLPTVANPARPNKNQSDAVDCRQEIDLRIGAAFTRFQTLRLRKRFDNVGIQSVVSYGPCQFPTLGFVVHRHDLIKSFIPEKFWYITLELDIQTENHTKQTVSFTWDRHRLYDKYATLILYEACVESTLIVVTKAQEKATSKFKPVPMNTIEFQKKASVHLKLSSERAMQV